MTKKTNYNSPQQKRYKDWDPSDLDFIYVTDVQFHKNLVELAALYKTLTANKRRGGYHRSIKSFSTDSPDDG